MDDHASYIGAHERELRDLVDEGFELPDKGVVLIYRDRRRDRLIVQLYPNRRIAEARPGGCRILPLSEAVA